MYLDEVFIKHQNINLYYAKKGLSFCFPINRQKVIRNKKRPQNATERTCKLNCKLEVIFKSPCKAVNHFHFKDVLRL